MTTQQLEERAKVVLAAKDLVWLDRKTTAAYLGIGTATLDRQAHLLKPARFGRRTIYKKSDLDAYLEKLRS